MKPRIANASCRKVNCYLVSGGGPLVAFDPGWPGSLYEYARRVKDEGFRLEDIAWVLVSHLHMDHAGLAGELQRRGARLVLFEGQAETIPAMETMIARKMDYVGIDLAAAARLETVRSRDWLAGLGIEGEVIPTPGHSEDSVSLVLDGGAVFVGDLYPERQTMEDDATARASWARIRGLCDGTVYPGHGPAYRIGEP